MTTTLNATTSNGLVVTPDNSGNVLLQYNGQSAPAFSVYNNTTQSISSSTETKVTLGTEVFDTNNNFANSTFTPTVAGYYQLNGGIRVGGSSIGYVYLMFYKNGSRYQIPSSWPTGQVTNNSIISGSTIVYMNGTTDYVELWGLIVATSPQFLYNDASSSCFFNGCLLRGA
jgi:hypothetical protein